mmetsp:Transcript_138079/g.327139  ORF Transcript_138079/g.327139 Transcript_138079/m.327139 type:complete len:91 (-) Transcript_138079:736-1008(-)
MGQLFSSKRGTSSQPTKGYRIDLKLQTINGDVHPVSIESSNSLLDLYEAVARAVDVNPWTLRSLLVLHSLMWPLMERRLWKLWASMRRLI